MGEHDLSETIWDGIADGKKSSILSAGATDRNQYYTGYNYSYSSECWGIFKKWYGDPGGDIGIWHEAEENGFERYEDYIDGYLRNWYVYVPESVKESGKKVSVLYYKSMFL